MLELDSLTTIVLRVLINKLSPDTISYYIMSYLRVKGGAGEDSADLGPMSFVPVKRV